MKAKRLLPVPALVFLLGTLVSAYAGDSASFVNLGFSSSGDFYMFAQYGVKSGVLAPWAELYVVDVARNDFVRGGRLSYTHQKPISAGQDGSGALYSLVARNAALAGQYGIIFPEQGQPLYIALDGDPAYAGETISFRDFVSGISYRAALVETIYGSGRDIRSSFYINLECDDGESGIKKYTIGTPNLRRPLVMSYRIKKALIAPPGNSIIFVIEMKCRAQNGHDIRYMVEAMRL
jgi:predicted secreted protein